MCRGSALSLYHPDTVSRARVLRICKNRAITAQYKIPILL
jgi:hypothetical protein